MTVIDDGGCAVPGCGADAKWVVEMFVGDDDALTAIMLCGTHYELLARTTVHGEPVTGYPIE